MNVTFLYLMYIICIDIVHSINTCQWYTYRSPVAYSLYQVWHKFTCHQIFLISRCRARIYPCNRWFCISTVFWCSKLKNISFGTKIAIARLHFQAWPINKDQTFYRSQKEYEMQKVVKVKGPRKRNGEGQEKNWNGQSQKQKNKQV